MREWLREGQVVHLTGEADREWMAAGYAEAGVRAEVWAFTERMAEVLAGADLVVGRAGASSLAELTAMGLPSVLLPYPHHRDRHQWHNAAVLEQAGAARVVEDDGDATRTGQRLGQALGACLGDDGALAAMATAAGRLGRPDAAKVAALALARVDYF